MLARTAKDNFDLNQIGAADQPNYLLAAEPRSGHGPDWAGRPKRLWLHEEAHFFRRVVARIERQDAERVLGATLRYFARLFFTTMRMSSSIATSGGLAFLSFDSGTALIVPALKA